MRVLITGGTGYLGRAIVRAVAARGHEVVVFARRATPSGLPGRLIDGDIRDGGAVRRAAAGVDAICHSAALVSLWRPRAAEFDEVNVGGVETILAVARELRIRRVVYTSSFLALPPAGHDAPLRANAYQRTKADALQVVRRAVATGARVVSLFPGVVYGPGADTEGNLVGRLLHDHARGRLPGVIGADRTWSFAYVDDVAGAHASAIEHGAEGAEYMAGGENAPQMRAFEIAGRIAGRRLPRRIPFGAATAIATLEEARARLTRRMPLITRGAVEIFRHDWPLDSRRSVDELNYRITPLENGIRATLARMPENR
jgi:nucleoside-diphosphate-sugar epimerase